ncbi:MAG: nuclear transport factor 2 family protein [Blastocatellales bacterium]
MSNRQTIQDVYAAFGRGDVPAILSVLDENIEWEYGMMDSGVPWFRKRKGRSEVAGFFEALGGVEFINFQPKTVLEGENLIVVLIDLTFKVKSTGKTVTEEDEIHIWHFDDKGAVTRFCHKCDTYQHWRATQSE